MKNTNILTLEGPTSDLVLSSFMCRLFPRLVGLHLALTATTVDDVPPPPPVTKKVSQLSQFEFVLCAVVVRARSSPHIATTIS